MREYRIEMMKSGRWRTASLPFNGIVGVTTEKDKAINMIGILKKEWQKAFDNGDLLYQEYMPTEYRIFSREVSEWVEEDVGKSA